MTTETPGAEPGRNVTRARDCAECGTPAVPGRSFCDGCGAVLRWSPGRRTAAASAEASAEPADAGEPGGVAAPGDAPSGAPAGAEQGRTAPPVPVPGTGSTDADGRAPAAGTGGPVPTEPVWPAEPAGPTAPAGHEPAGSGQDGRAEDDTEPRTPVTDQDRDRARALLVPVADPTPHASETPSVAPVLPGRPAATRPQVQRPGQEPDDGGGAPCPWCGTGNRPDRHFCCRCGMTMAGRPADPARRPWWRRLGFGNQDVPWAGERPRLRRGLGRIVIWVAGAAALTLVILAAFQVGPASQAVRDHFSKRAPVAPDSWHASRSFGGHGEDQAFDKFNNTWWGPGVAQSGDGEWIEARFRQPTRLLDVIITSGISIQPSDLAKAALPHRIEARITTADGHTTTRFLDLDQASGPQSRSFRVGSATAVRFIIRSAYNASATHQVSIAEIELFGRSTSSSSSS